MIPSQVLAHQKIFRRRFSIFYTDCQNHSVLTKWGIIFANSNLLQQHQIKVLLPSSNQIHCLVGFDLQHLPLSLDVVPQRCLCRTSLDTKSNVPLMSPYRLSDFRAPIIETAVAAGPPDKRSPVVSFCHSRIFASVQRNTLSKGGSAESHIIANLLVACKWWG